MDRRRILVVAAALVAILGIVLVLAYVHGADNRAKKKYDLVRVVAATKTINAGETVAQAQAAGAFDYADVASSDKVADAITDLSALSSNSVAQATIYAGEQIVADRFGPADTAASSTLPIPKGMVAVSVSLTDPQRVAGFVEPGSKVAVLANGTLDVSVSGVGGSGTDYSTVILPSVQVLGVGSTTPAAETASTTSTGSAPAETLPNTLLTLAVTQTQAQKIALAQIKGTLSLALLGEGSELKTGHTATQPDLFK